MNASGRTPRELTWWPSSLAPLAALALALTYACSEGTEMDEARKSVTEAIDSLRLNFANIRARPDPGEQHPSDRSAPADPGPGPGACRVPQRRADLRSLPVPAPSALGNCPTLEKPTPPASPGVGRRDGLPFTKPGGEAKVRRIRDLSGEAGCPAWMILSPPARPEGDEGDVVRLDLAAREFVDLLKDRLADRLGSASRALDALQ